MGKWATVRVGKEKGDMKPDKIHKVNIVKRVYLELENEGIHLPSAMTVHSLQINKNKFAETSNRIYWDRFD